MAYGSGQCFSAHCLAQRQEPETLRNWSHDGWEDRWCSGPWTCILPGSTPSGEGRRTPVQRRLKTTLHPQYLARSTRLSILRARDAFAQCGDSAHVIFLLTKIKARIETGIIRVDPIGTRHACCTVISGNQIRAIAK